MALLLVVVALAGCGEERPAAREYAVGLYAGEDAQLEEITAVLERIGERQLALQVAVRDGAFTEALATLLRRAADQRVEVRLWPLLPREEGYWPNEANVAAFAALVRQLLDWLDAERLVAHAIVYDMEPAIAYSEALQTATAAGVNEVLPLMRAHIDPTAHEEAKVALAASVREVQSRGLIAECVTFPQVVDDLEDGDNELQDALDIPVEGVPFDEIALMVYQSTYARAIGRWPGPGLIGSYAASARQHLGDRATIALGVVGKAGVMSEGSTLYEDPPQLQQDIAAALAEGVTRVEVFHLDGMLWTGQLDDWLVGLDAEPLPAATDVWAKLARQSSVLLDELLGAD